MSAGGAGNAAAGGRARIERRFAALAAEGRAGFVAYVMAGDPDLEASAAILAGLPAAGADLIEFGMAFTDPMADGPAVQAAGQRALAAGIDLKKTLAMIADLRARDTETPVILMGYYNPIHHYGVDAFLRDALAAGIDGLIVVDLPPEEDNELCLPAIEAGLSFIRLATPTTDDQRLPSVLANTTGFVYYVSYTGITGAEALDTEAVSRAVGRLKRHTDLPIAVGFGIKTAADAAAVARAADAAVVGSVLVERAREAAAAGREPCAIARHVLELVGELAAGVRGARI